MTAQPLFRELAYIDHLKQGGIDDRQARAMAEALNLSLSEAVATKADIERLESKMTMDISDLRLTTKAERGVEDGDFGTILAILGYTVA